MYVSVRKIALISVAALLFGGGVALGQDIFGGSYFTADTPNTDIVGQSGGTWTDPAWLGNTLGANNKSWWVEQPGGTGNKFIRSIGTGTTGNAYRSFKADGTAWDDAELDVSFKIAIQDNGDGGSGDMASNCQFRVMSNESTAAGDMRIRMQFMTTGEIRLGGASGTIIGYWDGRTEGEITYPDATDNFVTMLIHIRPDRTTVTNSIAKYEWGGVNLGVYPWNTTNPVDNDDLTDINLIGGSSGSSDPAVLGGAMIDDIVIESGDSHIPDCAAQVLPADKEFVNDLLGTTTSHDIIYTYYNYGLSDTNYEVAEVDEFGDPDDYGWLSVLPTSGGPIAPNGNSGDITATVNGTGLDVGTYTAYLKFTDDCSSPASFTREIELNIAPITVEPEEHDWTTWHAAMRVPNCPPGQQYVFTVTNIDDVTHTYTVDEVNRFYEPITANDWVEIELDLAHQEPGTNTPIEITLDPSESDTVTMTVTEDALTTITGTSKDVFLRFQTDSGGSVQRQIRIYKTVTTSPLVLYYAGDKTPNAANSFGTDYNFTLAAEEGNGVQGSVQSDPDAHDGRVWKITDSDTQMEKWRSYYSGSGSHVSITPRDGATVVARVKVEAASGTPGGNLLLYSDSGMTAGYHFGGPNQGRVKETERGDEDIDAGRADSNFHVIRMTAVGDEAQVGYPIRIRLYFDVDPTPVVTIDPATEVISANDYFGFGAASVAGTQTISFDWILATASGAYAPGEEVTCMGQALEPPPPPCNNPFADADGDGDVDQDDFAQFQLCYTGSTEGIPEGCECFNRDVDNRIDQVDWAAFEACASGPNIPADPGCD